MQKVVIYSRFSSDLQDEKSIEDQERVCEEYALQKGWTVISKFADRGISGASLHNRAEIQRLLKAAEVGMFDIVLSEALDRVSRDIEDTAKIYKTLTHHEVALHTLSEGEVNEMHVGLQGTMNAMFLKELKRKTRRGLQGRALMRLVIAHNEKEALKKQLEDINRQLENMLDRIVEANSASVVSAYETRIEKLERDKIVLQERFAKSIPPKGRLEDCIELSLKFLSSPWNIWKNGDFALRQTVLRLAFSEPLRYSLNGVYGTPEFSFPFTYLGGFSGSKSEMVLPERFELSTSPLPRECSTPELRQRW